MELPKSVNKEDHYDKNLQNGKELLKQLNNPHKEKFYCVLLWSFIYLFIGKPELKRGRDSQRVTIFHLVFKSPTRAGNGQIQEPGALSWSPHGFTGQTTWVIHWFTRTVSKDLDWKWRSISFRMLAHRRPNMPNAWLGVIALVKSVNFFLQQHFHLLRNRPSLFLLIF